MYSIRKATINDLDFIVGIDLESEGISTGNQWANQSADTLREHHEKMMKFVRRSFNIGNSEFETCPKYAYICIEKKTEKRIGLIMFLFRDMNSPAFQHFGVYDKFDRNLFPPDGKFCEIFQLWVAPEYRRQGLATKLKVKAEKISLKNNISMIYTHTEVINEHVIEMNKKLGYSVLRTGKLNDDIIRVSLVKHLQRKNMSRS